MFNMMCGKGRRRLVTTLAVIGGCHSLVDPPLPPAATAMAPPAVYATWWAMTEACSGLTGSLEHIQWFQVPGATTIPYPGLTDVSGYWSTSDRIVLAGMTTLDGSGVRHEMLHALLHSVGHPRAAFLTSCGGVVDCARPCVADAEPLPPLDPGTPVVTPNQLHLAIAVSPASPAIETDDGFFTVTFR
jgi:hypothetical protein